MMDRRTAIKHLGGAASALLLTETLRGEGNLNGQAAATAPPAPPTGPFTLPALPYAYDALEPSFDAETMHLHRDKHHEECVNNLNLRAAAHPEIAGGAVWELVGNLDSVLMAVRTAMSNNGGGSAHHSFPSPSLGKEA